MDDESYKSHMMLFGTDLLIKFIEKTLIGHDFTGGTQQLNSECAYWDLVKKLQRSLIGAKNKRIDLLKELYTNGKNNS